MAHPPRSRWWKLVLLGLAAAGCGSDALQTVVPPPQPGPALPPQARLGQALSYVEAPPLPGFPLPSSSLDGYQARGDEVSMRQHAWSMWASLTTLAPSGLPVMLTWYHNPEIFGEGGLADSRRFLPSILAGPRDNFGNGDPPTEINFYNRAYREHVRSQGYQWREALLSLLGQGAVNVVDFPENTIVAKTVWWPVRHDGLTALPV